MTLGQKIKKARTEANLTQKDLADQLSVTFQTVSKWESDTNEPDLTTLRAIAKLTNVSIEWLVSDEEEEPKPNENEPKPNENEPLPIPVPIPVPTPKPEEKKQLGACVDCGKTIMEGDHYHNVERRSALGIKEIVMVCDECFARKEDEMNRRAREIEEENKPKPKEQKGGLFHKIINRDDKKPLIWSIVLGIVALITTLVVCIINYNTVGIGWTIGAPLIAGYTIMATIYCIFTMSYISDVFTSVASWSVRFPGIIFSWSLDGLAFLIVMKLLFFVLGIFIGLLTFTLALGLSAVLSIFSFIPLLIYNKTHYE